MGSMSVDCRTRMEIEATEEAIRFIKGDNLISEVPKEEYDVQNEGL
jgi:D-3-phosphoglycerate dehydrogenase